MEQRGSWRNPAPPYARISLAPLREWSAVGTRVCGVVWGGVWVCGWCVEASSPTASAILPV